METLFPIVVRQWIERSRQVLRVLLPLMRGRMPAIEIASERRRILPGLEAVHDDDVVRSTQQIANVDDALGERLAFEMHSVVRKKHLFAEQIRACWIRGIGNI